MRCANIGCRVNVQLLKDVDGYHEWVHVEPGNPPYKYCRVAVATPDTIGTWAARLFDQRLRPIVGRD